MAKIKEFFTSIQGEGPYIGYKQCFVRFCTCNLNCKYCDTDFLADEKTPDYTAQELADIVNNEDVHSVSLTGGEPLLYTDFLKEFIPLCKHKIYLETNGTLPENLEKIIDVVDIIAADIKIKSATGNKLSHDLQDKFCKVASKKELFLKLVFSSGITDEEIQNACKLAQKYNAQLILQPQMRGTEFTLTTQEIENVFNKFVQEYSNVRLIPQMHKFLNIQ